MKRVYKLLFRKEFIILYLIFLVGFFLRTYRLWDNIIFSYDQARDAQRIYDMIYLKHLKIVGPETDIPGIFNGPLYYYLLAPVYFIFKFDPNYVALFLVLINLSTLFLIYLLAEMIFKDKRVGLISAFLWSISFEQSNFAKYISNASLISISTILFFFGLALYIFKKKDIGLTISIIGLASSIHFNFYLVYLIIFYFIYYYVFLPKINIRHVLTNLFLLILLLSSFFIAEIKFHFSGVKALTSYFFNISIPTTIIEGLSNYLQKLSETFYYSFFSFNHFIGLGLLFFFLLLIVRKERKSEIIFLGIWLFSTLPLFGFKSGVITVPVINASIFGATTLVVAGGIYELLKLNKNSWLLALFFLVLFSLSNLILYSKNQFLNYQALGQKAMFLSYEKKLIDYTYQKTNNNKFSICAISEPLFINTLWSYLYNYYGKNKYGYIPYWSGVQQYLNNNYLPYDKERVETRYLILEGQGGIPDYATKGTIFSEDQVSYIENEKKFGLMIVQKRKLTTNKNLLKDSQNLKPSEVSWLESVTKIDSRYSCWFNY